MLIRELVDGQEIDQALVVRGRSTGRVTLGDRSGNLVATLKEAPACGLEPGDVVRVAGRYEVTARGPELRVRELRAAGEHEYALETLIDGPPRTADPLAIDMTDLGKLQGEIPLGYYRIRRAIEDLPGFPERLAAAVLHIILAHHGTLEHGSPVVPCTREATLVHMIDNLGGRLGSFDRLEKELPDGSRW